MIDNKTLFKEIKNALSHDDVNVYFKDLGSKTCGEQLGNTIYLHPRQDILSTTIHETLHLLYPEWSENKVVKTEASICRSLSIKQFKDLLRIIAIKIK